MRDTLIKWFIEKYPYLTQSMKFTKHSYDDYTHSPFHLEDSIWTHTMMVMTIIQFMPLQIVNRKLLLIAGLLHDIGKIKTLESDHEDLKNRFKGHEGHSAMLSLEILEHLSQDFGLSRGEMEIIFKIISLHGINFKDIKGDLYTYLKYFRYADKNGAVRSVDEDIYSQYEPRKYSKNIPIQGKQCIIMCGLPNSGKSTYINKFLPNYKILSRDNAILEFAKTNYYNEAYRYCHSEENLENFNKFFEKQIQSIKNEDKIVIDMTMMSLSSRRKMMNNIGNREYSAYVILSKLDDINERNLKRDNKFINPSVYYNMCSSFVIPDISEGFKEVRIIWN